MNPEKDMLNYIFNPEVMLMLERMKVNEIYDNNVLIQQRARTATFIKMYN
jgi:hypothetical protein